MFQYSSIEQYHAQLKEGNVTCLQAVQHYLARIDATKHLNAFIEVFADEALEKAALLDAERKAGKSTGKLHGVIIGLKDVICYKGHRISAASHILKNFTSVYSATAVERLLAEGAIIIGNLNCDEFAMGSTNEKLGLWQGAECRRRKPCPRRFIRWFGCSGAGWPVYGFLRKRYRWFSQAAGRFLRYCWP